MNTRAKCSSTNVMMLILLGLTTANVTLAFQSHRALTTTYPTKNDRNNNKKNTFQLTPTRTSEKLPFRTIRSGTLSNIRQSATITTVDDEITETNNISSSRQKNNNNGVDKEPKQQQKQQQSFSERIASSSMASAAAVATAAGR